MHIRLKKLLGSLLLLALVIVYALIATSIALALVKDAPSLVQTAFYIIAGFLWIVPALYLIRWMQR